MRKTWIVARREYLQRVRSKAFVISTILGPLIMVGYIGFIFFIGRLQAGDARAIGIVHDDENIATHVREKLVSSDSIEPSQYQIKTFPTAGKSKAELLARLNLQINRDELQAYVYLPADFITAKEPAEPEYYAKSVGNFPEIGALRKALSDMRVEKQLAVEGVDVQKIREIIKPLKMKTIKVSKKGAREEGGAQFVVGVIFVFIQYMVILLYAIAVMRGVIEEKSNRMVEVILSSVKPFQYMMGKIIGVGAVGLTQVLVWTASALVLSLYGGAMYLAVAGNSAQAVLPTIPGSVLVFFLVYFLLGYFLYATLYAAIGSAVNTEQEAQSLQTPVTILIVLPMLLLSFVMRSPESTLATGLSFIPFLTPVLMFMRICILMPPPWQIALSIFFTIAFNLLLVWAAARIYRVGILMYGKKPTVPELYRWLRQA